MKTRETREFERLQRVDDFGATHRHAFPASSVAPEVFGAVGTAVRELAAADVMKLTAAVSARAGRRRAARKALYALLVDVSQLARVFRARGHTIPAFEVPESQGVQALLTAARQFAQDAKTLDAEFTAHGMGPAQINAMAGRLEDAVRDGGNNRRDHVAA